MQTNYLEMPTELFNQLGENKKFTREVNYAHGVCDQYSNLLYYCTMYEGKRYKTTLEQKKQAEKLYNINVKNAVENIGNKLMFVGMGMTYNARYENDVCNHRIRTEIKNTKGRRFFIEVGTWGDELMRIDFVIDRDQENEYTEKAKEYREKIEKAGGFWKIGKGHHLYNSYQKYMSQPYYWYKKDEWHSLRTKYTKENVLKLVNKLFDCNFTELEIDNDHLTTELYTSVSPK
jgi:hypothetical protein